VSVSRATDADSGKERIGLGDKLNGKLLPVVTDTRLAEGGIGFSTKHLVRDVEILNLDGLSEAEARKAAGIGE
jgi:hypothetical protein